MLSAAPAPHCMTHVSVNFCKSPEVSSMFDMYQLGADFLPPLHHWCNTPMSSAPIALRRYSCLQLASSPLAVAPKVRWIHSPAHGNGGQRRFCSIPCGCHRTSLGQLSCRPRHLSCHLRPPRHLSCHPRHQEHLFGPLQHFLATPLPSIAKNLAKAPACREALREAQAQAQAQDPPPPRRLRKAEPRGPRPLTAKQRVRKLLKARKTPQCKER